MTTPLRTLYIDGGDLGEQSRASLHRNLLCAMDRR